MRVLRYRQHKPDDTVVQGDWLTDWPTRRADSLSLYRMAKSRWEIENQGFNDAKNRYGIEHICHREPNSILLNWLLTFLALVIERLYRVRYLHLGTHRVRSAASLYRLFWLGLARTPALDSG
ncbi:MAG: transposase [Acidobacteria bacterium]|nr:transposase [Acidobacteriota bacterium]